MSGRRAGVVSRLLVAGIDFLVAGAILFGILVAIGVVRYLLGSGSFRLPKAGNVFTLVWFPIVAFVYLTTSWRATGRTVGKELFGLRVACNDGAPLKTVRASGRAVFCILFGGPSLLWSAVSRRNQAIHDHVFRTAVVHDWSDLHSRSPLPTGGNP